MDPNSVEFIMLKLNELHEEFLKQVKPSVNTVGVDLEEVLVAHSTDLAPNIEILIDSMVETMHLTRQFRKFTRNMAEWYPQIVPYIEALEVLTVELIGTIDGLFIIFSDIRSEENIATLLEPMVPELLEIRKALPRIAGTSRGSQ